MAEKCRICLRSNQTVANSLLNCLDIIKDIAQIDLTLDETLPNLICTECVERLLDARAIKEMCIKSEEYFTKKLNTDTVSKEFDIDIDEMKEEPMDSEYEEFEFLIDEKVEVGLNNPDRLSIRCCICNQYFIEESCLKAHCLKDHKWRIQTNMLELLEYQCPVCTYTFKEFDFSTHSYQIVQAKKRIDLQNKVRKPTNDIIEITCCQCSTKHNTLDAVRNHLKVAHPDYQPIDMEVTSKKLQCKVCFGTFISVKELGSHSKIEKQLFPCLKCNKLMEKIGDIKLHYEQEHPESSPIYKCNQCERIYDKYTSFYSHLYKFHRQDFRNNICDMCGKVFVEASYLQTHVETYHYGIRKYICSLCSKAFPSKNNLRSHMRSHTGEKPYKCPHCSKCYGFYTDWKTHIAAKHTGIWPLHCQRCNRGFMKPSQLKIHQRTHLATE